MYYPENLSLLEASEEGFFVKEFLETSCWRQASIILYFEFTSAGRPLFKGSPQTPKALNALSNGVRIPSRPQAVSNENSLSVLAQSPYYRDPNN